MKINLKDIFFGNSRSTKCGRFKAKPFMMKVRLVDRSYRCGYGICYEEERVLHFKPVDEEMIKLYGEDIEVYSNSLSDCLKNDEVVVLPFVKNPDYDPNIINSQPVLLFVSNDRR